jgi:phytoene synthase
VSRRTVVPASRKALCLARALAWAALPARSVGHEAPTRTRFLVDAVGAAPVPADAVPSGLGGRVRWVIELFERLERRDRAAGPVDPSYAKQVAPVLRGGEW